MYVYIYVCVCVCVHTHIFGFLLPKKEIPYGGKENITFSYLSWSYNLYRVMIYTLTNVSEYIFTHIYTLKDPPHKEQENVSNKLKIKC